MNKKINPRIPISIILGVFILLFIAGTMLLKSSVQFGHYDVDETLLDDQMIMELSKIELPDALLKVETPNEIREKSGCIIPTNDMSDERLKEIVRACEKVSNKKTKEGKAQVEYDKVNQYLKGYATLSNKAELTKEVIIKKFDHELSNLRRQGLAQAPQPEPKLNQVTKSGIVIE